MSLSFIDLKTQQERIAPELERRMKAVLDHGQYIMGPEVAELEGELSRYVGVRDCIAVASGTEALLVALMALGVGAGDEVVTSPFTFIATAETIALLGAVPVFVDIDPRTYNLDPALLEGAITARTKAVLPVSLYGQCADFGAIDAVVERCNETRRRQGAAPVAVIEDGCQSFGASYRGRKSCSLSTIGCTSFFPSKPLGCYGDGGACFTDDAALAARMRQLRVHGQDRRYHHPVLGINGRLDTLQAAILLAKLPIFEEEVRLREVIGARYSELLGDLVRTPHIEPHATSVYAQYTVQVPEREGFQARLKARGIPTAVHYPVPLHLQPAFAHLGLSAGSFPEAERAAARVVSLPMHPYLSEAQQREVAAAVKDALIS